MIQIPKICITERTFFCRNIHLVFAFLVLHAVACKDRAGAGATAGRRFHIINLSLPRTGSGSLWGLFSKYNSQHEFMREETIHAMLDYREGKKSRTDLVSFLQKRDAREPIEMDSANFFYMEPTIVIEAHPDAGFYLAVRNCHPWVVSFLDLMYVNFGPQPRAKGVDLQWVHRYGKSVTPKFDVRLFSDLPTMKKKLQPLLPELARFWGKSTVAALEAMKTLPARRRLVVRTDELSSSLDRLAVFAGIDRASLDESKVHLNPDRGAHQIDALFDWREADSVGYEWQQRVEQLISENGLISR